MIAERHFKNEDIIKDKIVKGRRRGICDRNGSSLKVNGIFTAKSRSFSSLVKTYVFREGKMVLKNG